MPMYWISRPTNCTKGLAGRRRKRSNVPWIRYSSRSAMCQKNRLYTLCPSSQRQYKNTSSHTRQPFKSRNRLTRMPIRPRLTTFKKMTFAIPTKKSARYCSCDCMEIRTSFQYRPNASTSPSLHHQPGVDACPDQTARQPEQRHPEQLKPDRPQCVKAGEPANVDRRGDEVDA